MNGSTKDGVGRRAGGLDPADGMWARKRRRGGDVKACRLSMGVHLRSRDWVGADVDEQRLDEGCLAEELVAHHQLEGRVEVRQEDQVAERFPAMWGWGTVGGRGVAPPGVAGGGFEGSAGDEEAAQQQGEEGVGCGEEAGGGGGSARDADGVEGGR